MVGEWKKPNADNIREDSAPASNGSGSKGWGNGFIQKKDVSPKGQSRQVYDFLHDHDHAGIKPIPEARTEDVPTTMFGDAYNTTAYAQKKDISANNVDAGVHGAVSGMIDPLPEPRDGLMAW